MNTILLIEDHDDIRETVADILESEGYSVLARANGREALDTLENLDYCPDAIVLDLKMPVMGGVEFLEAVRERPDWLTIPIIITSGTIGQQEVGALGAVVGALRKPVEIPELLALLASCCERITSGGDRTDYIHAKGSRVIPASPSL